MSTGFHPRQALIGLVSFATLILAALQNVTVDDAVLVGPVVPEYLPAQSDWNRGPNCTICFVQPDPSQAYNGTWHDVTYSPSNGYNPSITISFTGSAVYVYFILANNVPFATTLTNVSFLLDGIYAGTFTHQPSTSSSYQYNVAVYANNSLTFGQHSIVVEPADTTRNASDMLVLFDYFVYTTNTTSTTTSSSIPSLASSATSSPSQVSSAPNGTSSSTNTGAIIGGVVAGVAVLAFIIAYMWYRRYKRRRGTLSPPMREVIDAFPASSTTAMMMSHSGETPSSSSAQGIVGSPFGKLEPLRRGAAPSSLVPSSTPLSTYTSSSVSNPPSSNAVHGLLEQMEQLREEVAQLREHQNEERSIYELGALPPPEYSESTNGSRG